MPDKCQTLPMPNLTLGLSPHVVIEIECKSKYSYLPLLIKPKINPWIKHPKNDIWYGCKLSNNEAIIATATVPDEFKRTNA